LKWSPSGGIGRPPSRDSVEYRSSRRDASSDLAGTAQNASICAAKASQSIVASVNTEPTPQSASLAL
jgi:hypothetical protein